MATSEEPASRIANDPSYVVGQVASLLGTGNIRVQRLYQASTDGWSMRALKSRVDDQSQLLFVARMADTDAGVIGAYTEKPVAGVKDWAPIPSESFLFSIRQSSVSSLLDAYVEKPLAQGHAYCTVESVHPITTRANFTQCSTINLPGTTSYKVTFDKRSKVGHDTNSSLVFNNEGNKQLGVYHPGQLAEGNYQARVLNWSHTYHASAEVWGYKFTAWSDATAESAISLSDDGIKLGSVAGGSRLIFDLKNRQVIEPDSIDDTRAGFEASPGEGCWRYFSGGWDEEHTKAISEFEVWLIEKVEEDEDLPEAEHPIISQPPMAALSSRTIPQEEVERLWGCLDLTKR